MFTVCQNPNLIIPLKNSTFGALERHHKVGSLGERSKKKKKNTGGRLRRRTASSLEGPQGACPRRNGSPSGWGVVRPGITNRLHKYPSKVREPPGC